MAELDKMLITTPAKSHDEFKDDLPKMEEVDLENDNDASVPNLEVRVIGETCESLSKMQLSMSTSNDISRSEDYEDANETLSMQPMIEEEQVISSNKDDSSQVVIPLEEFQDDVSLPESPAQIKKRFLGTSSESKLMAIPHFRPFYFPNTRYFMSHLTLSL